MIGMWTITLQGLSIHTLYYSIYVLLKFMSYLYVIQMGRCEKCNVIHVLMTCCSDCHKGREFDHPVYACLELFVMVNISYGVWCHQLLLICGTLINVFTSLQIPTNNKLSKPQPLVLEFPYIPPSCHQTGENYSIGSFLI